MNNVTKLSFNRYKYQNKIYKEHQWFNLLSDFKVFNSEQIVLRNNMINLDLSYIKKIYLDNVHKSTFLGLFLPCIVFLCLLLMNTLILLRMEYEPNTNVFIFLIFLTIVYFTFSIIFLIKILKKKKLVYSYNRYNYLDNKVYLEKLRIFTMHQYIFFKPLITSRLIIREFTCDDYLDYYEFASSENVCKYLNVDVLKDIDEAKNILKRVINEYHDQQIFKLAIMLKGSNKVIGYVGLSRYDLTVESCQLVYAINEKYWHQGYVSEVVAAFVRYLQANGKNLIIAGHVKENIASGKVLLKNGFIRDSSRDYKMVIHGELKDIISYSIDERKNV